MSDVKTQEKSRPSLDSQVQCLVIWKPNKSKYCQGNFAFLGKWKVGEFFWDGAQSQGSELHYKAKCFLPGIKDTLGNFKTEEEAKATVEYAVNYWMDKTEVSI